MKEKLTKEETITHFFIFFMGFIAFGSVVIFFNIYPTKYMTYNLGLATGFVMGIILMMCLFLLAKYQNLREKDKRERDKIE